SASSAMMRTPDAEPVSAARMLVATPQIEATQSRTIAKAGRAATTAPKPTRLATLSAGGEALAPASRFARSEGRRRQLSAMDVAMAEESAVTKGQTGPPGAGVVAPHRCSAR